MNLFRNISWNIEWLNKSLINRFIDSIRNNYRFRREFKKIYL